MKTHIVFKFIVSILLCGFSKDLAAGPQLGFEVYVDKGIYKPFFRDVGEADQKIGPLIVDAYPVTNREFSIFLANNKNFVRSKIARVFASESYLEHWSGDQDFTSDLSNKPVTNISWFVARKYCESFNKRLMSSSEWEYVSDSSNPKNLDLVLNWYAKPGANIQPISKFKANAFGIYGMHGQIWEWVEDFSSAILSGDSRSSNESIANLFCGSSALKARDPSQYASFMRFAYRSSLRARFVGRNLGFRCARDVVRQPEKSRK